MADKSVLIIGASRGIGLGLATEFSSRGWRVIASERSRSDDLHALAQGKPVEIVTVDVTEPDSYEGLAAKLGEKSLDAIIVNAGVTGAAHQSAEQATDEDIAQVMQTNAYGPVRMARSLLPAIKDGGMMGFMSSLMGSIADSSGGFEFYRVSKASLNMLAKGIAEQQAKARVFKASLKLANAFSNSAFLPSCTVSFAVTPIAINFSISILKGETCHRPNRSTTLLVE